MATHQLFMTDFFGQPRIPAAAYRHLSDLSSISPLRVHAYTDDGTGRPGEKGLPPEGTFEGDHWSTSAQQEH